MLVALLMKPEEPKKGFRLQSIQFVELVKEMHFTVVILYENAFVCPNYNYWFTYQPTIYIQMIIFSK